MLCDCFLLVWWSFFFSGFLWVVHEMFRKYGKMCMWSWSFYSWVKSTQLTDVTLWGQAKFLARTTGMHKNVDSMAFATRSDNPPWTNSLHDTKVVVRNSWCFDLSTIVRSWWNYHWGNIGFSWCKGITWTAAMGKIGISSTIFSRYINCRSDRWFVDMEWNRLRTKTKHVGRKLLRMCSLVLPIGWLRTCTRLPGGPLPDLNGVMTPISRVKYPKLPRL